ncbi:MULTISPECIES: hypothetical protein [unclassified Streptomyces]
MPPSHLWVANGLVTGNCIIRSMGARRSCGMAELR